MIFQLDCVKYFFSEKEKTEYEKMGFVFKEDSGCFDPDYKFTVKSDELPTLIFHDIEVLKAWVNQFFDGDIIISFKEEPPTITLYDEYME